MLIKIEELKELFNLRNKLSKLKKSNAEKYIILRIKMDIAILEENINRKYKKDHIPRDFFDVDALEG